MRFTPEITLRPGEAVFLEIGKCRSLYSEETFLKRMRVMLARYGDVYARDARVAIEDDATRALVQAKYGATVRNSISGSTANSAGGIFSATGAPSFDSLDLSALPFSSFYEFADPFLLAPTDKDRKPIETMIHSLKLLGLRSVSDFMRIPQAELAARFGAIALHIRSQIENSRDLTWPRWTPQEIIEETIELAHDDYCNWLEPLLFFTKHAIDRLYSRLQGRGLRCARLQVELKIEKYSTVRRPIRTFDFDFMMPQGTTRGTMPILQERFEREFATDPLEAAVLRVRTIVRETTPGYRRQQHLFDHHDDIAEAYHSIVSHLAESLGQTRVFRAVVQESRFPEKSWKKRQNEKETHADVATVLTARPSRLLAKPRKIEVTKENIFLLPVKGARGAGKVYTITSWSRVERISADWLESPEFKSLTRNYYQVAIAEGPPLWIYEDESREFYLQGWYE